MPVAVALRNALVPADRPRPAGGEADEDREARDGAEDEDLGL